MAGDQHLSNFGAWRNRHRDVVFGVNDFDEAAIYDFHIDVLRITVSIYNHALSNGLGAYEAEAAVLTFTETYVNTLTSYVGNEKALLFELTSQYAKGRLGDFLRHVEQKASEAQQLGKFTRVDENGRRRFIRSKETRLTDLPEEEVPRHPPTTARPPHPTVHPISPKSHPTAPCPHTGEGVASGDHGARVRRDAAQSRLAGAHMG